MSTFLRYEPAFWAVVVAVSVPYDLYYIVTSLSFCATRLHFVLWPFARFPIIPRLILVCLSIWCYFLTPAHVFTFTLMDLWTPYSIHPPLNPIEVVHDPGENAVVDVFAIHGLGSNPDSAWTYRDNVTEIRWLKDILPKEQGLVNTRVVMVNHRTQWYANTVDASFDDHAEMILKEVENVHKTLLLAKLRSSPISAMTRGILFLGVPHSGTRAAFIASLLSCTAYWRGSSTTLLEYMAPGSEHIKDLERKFYDNYAHPHSTHTLLPYICDFQEMRSERFGRFSLGPRNQTVDRNSGRSSHGDVVQLDTDHRGLNKFRSPQDPNFRRFLRHFIKAFETTTNVGNTAEPATPNTFATRLRLKGLVDEKGLNSTLDEHALDVVEAMKNWFAETLNRGWLLILDNLDDLETFNIMDYIPRSAWGSILITSRRRGFLSYGTTIEISEMSIEEGLSLLAKISRFGRNLNPDEQRLALKLLQSLGYFPLAIEQAGAYISQRASDDPESYCRALENYLDSYERNAKMLLQHKPLSIIWSNRNDSALTTWEVSFDAIKQESPEAADLLQLCGFLANSDIFEEMFSLGGKLAANDTTFQESISKLSSYSLVSLRGARDAFSIHPLVHFWVRERLPLDVQQRLANDVLKLIARGLRLKKEGELKHYVPFERRIIPHLDHAADNMRRFLSSFTTEVSVQPPSNPIKQSFYDTAEGCYLWAWGAISDISISCRRYLLSDIESIGEKWRLAYKLGSIYRNQGHWQSAEKIYGWAFTEARTQLHGEHPKTLEIAGDLAWAILSQGRYDDASDWYTWLLASRKKVLGNGHHSTLGAMKGLASISNRRGNYSAALQLYFEALAGRQKRLGPNDILTINVMVDIAQVFQDQGKYEEALRWYERALTGHQETLGEKHERTLQTIHDIGSVFYHQGQYEEALRLYERTLAGRQETLGEKHEGTLRTIHNIARVFHDQGQYEEALRWYERTLAGRQETLGEKHEGTLHTIHNIARVFHDQGQYEEALRWYERTLAGRQETLGEKHEETLYTIHNIARVFHDQGQYEEALRWYERTLAGRQETLGEKHEETLHTIHNIARVFRDQGQYDEALRWFERTLAGRQETLGEKHEETLHTLHNIALVFHIQGRYEEALRWYERTLAGRQETLGEKHEETLYTIHNIAWVFHIQGRYEEALRWYERTLAGRQETLGEKHKETLHTLYNIGLIFQNQGKYKEALRWYERALAGYRETLGEKHKDTLDTLDIIHKIGLVFQ
ncbi:hypothetical protein N7466_010074 [Penicillium verhagenii]|uniref:uncharacterized protein n=1 Tax=Penicillium verhagenii TaxID=1562060 RepID=UPI002545472F|nr:uncharacterized protein N7466_010074 [Penicillium verhagenii]KAJ5919131.1 hypothetical protein N7466_010074 [Penicillium verhagenii]